MYPRLLQQNIVERLLRDKEGRLARVTFYVYEFEGRLNARVLDVVYLEEKPSEKPLALCGCVADDSVIPESDSSPIPFVSPYFNKNFIYTVGSKPRAPSFE